MTLDYFFRSANRIVFTDSEVYNPKKKKENHVIADIRDAQQIKNLYLCLEIIYDPNPDLTGWMSPPDRKAEWQSDFSLTKYEDYKAWLLKNPINVPFT